MSWLVVGLSGATCAGKTTLAKRLTQILPNARRLNQDDFYHQEDDRRHVWIDSLGHINWELVSACDMDKMLRAARDITGRADHSGAEAETLRRRSLQAVEGVSGAQSDTDLKNLLEFYTRPVLVLDGITIFDDPAVAEICRKKFFLTLDLETCRQRRQTRVYDPPDVEGYFEQVVWPTYERNLAGLRGRRKDVVYLDGSRDLEQSLKDVVKAILTDGVE